MFVNTCKHFKSVHKSNLLSHLGAHLEIHLLLYAYENIEDKKNQSTKIDKAKDSKVKILVKDNKLIKIKDGEEQVLGNAIIPVAHQTNIDTNEIKILLEFDYRGNKIKKMLPRKEINKNGIKELTKYGAECWEVNADGYVEYIRENIDNAKETFEHSKVGLGTYKDNKIFKLYEAIGINSRYDKNKYDIKPSGSYEEWKKMIEREVIGRPYLEFALVVGFLAPVINIITEENSDSIIINFCGTSSTGKTVATKLALSPWGATNNSEGSLLKSWFGTDQGILSSLGGNFGIPIGLDDTSLQNKDKDFTQLVYQIVNGQSKSALNIDGTNRRIENWKTVVVSSSEESISENTDVNKKGVRVRLFELNVPYITESAENAENIDEVVSKNYGHAGMIFTKNLMEKDINELTYRIKDIRNHLLERLNKDALSNRISLKLANIVLTAELIKESLNLNINIDTLINTLIEMENKSTENRNIAEIAYEKTLEYFQTNSNKFFEEGAHCNNIIGYVGKYKIGDNDTVIEISIPKNEFEKLINKFGYNPNEIINKWKEHKLLKCDKGKNTINRVFVPNTPRIAMYAIKIKDDKIEAR